MERAELEQWKGREVARLLALVESERRYYQEIVAAIPVGLLVVSSDLTVVSSNRAARRILGLRISDPIRGHLDMLLPAWALEKIQGVFKDCERVDNLMVDHAGRRLRVSALPIRNGDDETQYEALLSLEDLTGTSVTLSPQPAPTPAPQPTAPDIAEQKPVTAETPVAESAPQVVQPEAIVTPPQARPSAQPSTAERSSAEPSIEPVGAEAVELLQSLDAIVWAIDIPTMTFLFVTNTAEEVLGFSPDHWLSTPNFWSERIHTDDREAVLSSYRDSIEQGQRHVSEFRAHASDGRVVWLRETARILADSEGRPKHLIGLTTDITERRLLEENHVRAERTDAIGKLAARLSHDLNNMLMIVNGYGEELLHNVAKNDPLRGDIQEILRATNRISSLTNELLAFTRKPTAAAETIDISEVLDAIRDDLKKVAGPALAVEIETDPGLLAKAAREHLEQLLGALAVRSKAAMRENGKLAIKAGETVIHEDLLRDDQVLAPGPYAVVSIEDNGGLLSHDAQMALFESFLPVKELPEETGAILSRNYSLVRQWGGDISVVSTPGGTRISIYLPYAGRKEVVAAPPVEERPAPASVETPAPVVPAEPQLETILVVEDEGGIRALVRKILRRQGYTVLEASNGEEATKTCREHSGRIHLLITDVMMPKMGGRELVDTLKDQCGEMKVLYVSGYTDDAGIYAGDFPPGTAFLQKPFTLGSLLDKVKEVLSQ